MQAKDFAHRSAGGDAVETLLKLVVIQTKV
jgi:hypothetical protein